MTEQAKQAAAELAAQWANDPRWAGVQRTYSAEDVIKLRGSVVEEHTLARRGAEKLWDLLHTEDYIHALGALTGNQAVQQVRAGLQAIYLSGWQVAADANLAGQTYPDQSLYPANSVPAVVRRINNALLRRADQIDWAEGDEPTSTGWRPIVADAEAGFGGPLNAFELMKGMIAAGAAGVHWEDQLASEKKCGHLGGKVLIPTSQHDPHAERGAPRGRRAGRADAGRRPHRRAGRDAADQRRRRARPASSSPASAPPRASTRSATASSPCIARGLAYAPYADLLWMETSEPDLEVARKFAEAIKAEVPGPDAGLQLLARRSTGRSTWTTRRSRSSSASSAHMGYKFQFITLAGFHALNHSMFDLAHGYAREGMTAYVELQEREFAAESRGYTATKHQREVGTGYFDQVATALNPESSTTALKGSTEEAQFH